ncbi:MAG: UDP-N-acetylmuramoyl-L-alanine--D-glutamate ligase, partial [Acidaminococcaceae bacterium]|nr:UDP-N-acetylmuramoyl-L-alanine--D-glutamate ligase [Acidaminococcaceae bacterium]
MILLAGGHDKMTPLEPMMRLVSEKVDLLILLGEARERFYEAAVAAHVPAIIVVDTFKEAVETAYAKAHAPQVVLLSPACSSFDMFHDMGERGRYFKKLVRDLAKEAH